MRRFESAWDVFGIPIVYFPLQTFEFPMFRFPGIKISTGHARALLAIEDEEQQYMLANKIFDEKLSVRETEKLVKALKNPKKEEKKPEVENQFVYTNLEEQMKSLIGTKVSVHAKANGKGKIEIEYYSPDDLERIYELLMTIQHN